MPAPEITLWIPRRTGDTDIFDHMCVTVDLNGRVVRMHAPAPLYTLTRRADVDPATGTYTVEITRHGSGRAFPDRIRVDFVTAWERVTEPVEMTDDEFEAKYRTYHHGSLTWGPRK